MKKMIVVMLLVMCLLAACSPQTTTPEVSYATAEVSTVMPGGGGGLLTEQPFATPEPPTAIPPLSAGDSPTELKYRLLDKYPDLFFCDPDFYPVARADETELALQHFPDLQANAEEFQAILSHNNLVGLTTFTDAQKVLIYQEHKRLAAIQFELSGDKYQFQLQIADNNQNGFRITGTIDAQGNINEQQREPGIASCPICLAAHTLIDTPRGQVAVEDLRVGDSVWTADAHGARLVAVVLQTVRTYVPVTHQVVHVVLEDGRQLFASPGHPTVEGRTLGELKVGDILDGAHIISVERVQYTQPATYDLLPSGDTGFYWADGILIGSTLSQP